jgi:hypothetical protein
LPHRGTPLAFTPEFFEDENKVKQWKAFCNKNKPRVQEIEFKTLIGRLVSFLTPVIQSAQNELLLDSKWTIENEWQPPPRN